MLFRFRVSADFAAFAFVQAEGDKVNQRLQFNDTTTSVQRSKSEVKEEDVNTIPPTVTEETKSSQSDVLPPSTPNQKIGRFKEEENNIDVGASQRTYHLLNPQSLPYSTRQGFHIILLLKLG